MRNITNYIFPEQQDLVSNVRSALSSFVKNQTNSSYLYNNYFLKHQLLRTSFLFTRSHCLQRADSNAISLTYCVMSTRKYTSTSFNFKSFYCSTFTPHVILKITLQYLAQDNQLIITSPFLSYLAVIMRSC